jgi:hypothetical protein
MRLTNATTHLPIPIPSPHEPGPDAGEDRTEQVGGGAKLGLVTRR